MFTAIRCPKKSKLAEASVRIRALIFSKPIITLVPVAHGRSLFELVTFVKINATGDYGPVEESVHH